MLKDILRSVKYSIAYLENTRPVQKNLIVFTSRNGKDFAGNMLRLLIELHTRYGSKFCYLIGAEKESQHKIRRLIDAYGMSDVKIVRYASTGYFCALQRASYLFNDTTFPLRYVKRPGQVYINTWHGTPLKKMGLDSTSSFYGNGVFIDNIQRNLFASDYLVFPNDYFQNVMAGAYSLNGLYTGTILREGYPRNSIFLDSDLRLAVREKYDLSEKRVYVYMPTFREASHNSGVFSKVLMETLDMLDKAFSDDEIFYIKLHYYEQAKLPLADYRHIKLYPEDIESYEFLNAADCLVSDYSSVIFDFAVSRRKIVRYVFDLEQYEGERGLYQQPVGFPFPVVISAEELLRELRSGKQYSDNEFIETYCAHENKDAAERIIDHIFEGKSVCEEYSLLRKDKEKVFFFAGALPLNGITKSAQNLMEMVGDDRLYYISFSEKMLAPHPERLINLPQHDGIIEINGEYCCTLTELTAFFLYYKCGLDFKLVRNRIKRFYKREARRTFTGMGVDTYIHFDGYGIYVTGLIQNAYGRRIIFVHNDMRLEIHEKKNQNELGLRDAYKNYDKVAVVSKSLVNIIGNISGSTSNIEVVENCQNFAQILDKANQQVEMQKETRVFNKKNYSIEAFLETHEKIFMTIGRFSKEKRHEMLISAFEKIDTKGIGLVIIGGEGKLLEKVVTRAVNSPKADDILIIFSIRNPMPILKHADLFLLSSEYEGMPMVLYEAACLGVPIVTVDTIGCHEFMTRYKGMLVKNSEQGLVYGMKMALLGKVPKVEVNFDNYNAECVSQFEKLLKTIPKSSCREV